MSTSVSMKREINCKNSQDLRLILKFRKCLPCTVKSKVNCNTSGIRQKYLLGILVSNLHISYAVDA